MKLTHSFLYQVFQITAHIPFVVTAATDKTSYVCQHIRIDNHKHSRTALRAHKSPTAMDETEIRYQNMGFSWVFQVA